MICSDWSYDTSENQDLFRSLQELSHSDVCPDSMALCINGAEPMYWKFLKHLPSKCSLAELNLSVDIGSTDGRGCEQLDFVVNDLLLDRLTKLGLYLDVDSYDDDDEEEDEVDDEEENEVNDDVEDKNYESPLLRVKPWISKIMSSEKLTSLCLGTNGFVNENKNAEYLIDGILASKLEELRLVNMTFKLKSDDLTRWASVTGCRLRRVHVTNVQVDIEDPSCFCWNNISFPLEELTLEKCDSLQRLLESHGSPWHSLRVLTVEKVDRTSILDFITVLFKSNAKTLTKFTMDSSDMVDVDMEKPFRELFKHCQGLETVTMRFRVESSFHTEAILKAAFLNLPKLQTLESPRRFHYLESECKRSVFEATADRAHQWPGKEAVNSSLTLSKLPMKWAVHAALVFRERKLNYKIKYIEHKTYEMWFPPDDGGPSARKTATDQQ